MVAADRISTGIAGLDDVLGGGLIPKRTYLFSGAPGTGKTTFGWHFLCEGSARGERVLYVTFAEPADELRMNAERSGFDCSHVEILDLTPSPDIFTQAEAYDLFSASEVEREPTTERIVEAIERHRPERVFVDSLTHLRSLAVDAFQFRRQALAFLRFLARNATVVATSESTGDLPDDDLRYLVDGIIELTLHPRERFLNVTKLRGSPFRAGMHGFRLTNHGASVYPRLLPEEYARAAALERISSGIVELDALTNGGIERASITLMTGPTGVGKTTLALQFLVQAALRGERSIAYLFDERAATVRERCQSIGMPVERLEREGTLQLVEIEALRFGPDEFASRVRRDIEEFDTRHLAIDSVSGYRMTITSGDLNERLHALGRYLTNVGVTVIMVDELKEIAEFRGTDIGISYLADNLLFLRYIELENGDAVELRKAIGVLKKRLSDFEKTVREFRIEHEGLRIGPPLRLSSVFAQLPLVKDGAIDSPG